jgi:hypothetical protein
MTATEARPVLTGLSLVFDLLVERTNEGASDQIIHRQNMDYDNLK